MACDRLVSLSGGTYSRGCVYKHCVNKTESAYYSLTNKKKLSTDYKAILTLFKKNLIMAANGPFIKVLMRYVRNGKIRTFIWN